MIYIVTFYSHFGAIKYKKFCENRGISAQMMPVPRDLSSSCGTCVKYESELVLTTDECTEEIEQIVRQSNSGYEIVYRAENS